MLTGLELTGNRKQPISGSLFSFFLKYSFLLTLSPLAVQTRSKFQFFIHCLRKFQNYKTVHDSEVSDMLSLSTLLRMWHVIERQ